MVYRLALAHVRTTHDAEDVFQEVFLRYIAKPRSFESEEHRKAWLLRATLNCCKSLQSSAWFRRRLPLDEELPAPAPEVSEVRDAVQALPARYRAAVHLFYYEGYSVAEIALLTDKNESTVKSQLHRARGLLRTRLKGDYDDV